MRRRWRSSYTEQMQRIVAKYRQAGQEWPATARHIAEWAVKYGHWEIAKSSIVEKCAEDLARAMREEYYIDPQGRTVRTKHAARIKRGEKQLVFWADIRTAGLEHMRVAFQQRRNQVAADCRQLKTDVDSYNQNADPGEPIQMIFDFTHDLEETETFRQAS